MTARLLALTLLVATGMLILLARQHADLRERHEQLVERVQVPYAGLYLPTTQLAALDSNPITIASPGDPQVLFFFTTTCPYCRESLPAWSRIATELEQSGAIRAVGVALDSLHLTQDYVRVHDLRWPVSIVPDRRTAMLLRAGAVPLTVVVNDQGQVVYSRKGLVSDGATIDSVLAAVAALRAPSALSTR